MTRIASNEKFKFSKKLSIPIFLLFTFFPFILTVDPILTIKNILTYDLKSQEFLNIDLSLSKFINIPNTIIIIVLIVYLLVTLIAIVKITQSNIGPLRPRI